LKENVIMGRLIPAGTGLEYYRNVELIPEEPEPADEIAMDATDEAALSSDELHEDRLTT
jgi:DNA-directed RNA polymerase subunit beta'